MIAALSFTAVVLFLIIYLGGAAVGFMAGRNFKETAPLMFLLTVIVIALVVTISANVMEPLVREIMSR